MTNSPQTSEQDTLSQLIEAITTKTTFDHPVEKFEIRETHISRLLLTGDYVYKFKKPVDFGFLDFTTLEKRKFYCNEEMRLNHRLAPELYLDVVSFTGDPSRPELNGKGAVIEYAVKMRQFPKGSELDDLLKNNEFEKDWLDVLAEKVAGFHKATPSASETSPYGTYESIYKTTFENIIDLEKTITHDKTCSAKLHTIKTWASQNISQHKETIFKRKQNGFIKECHGDLHLGNITLYIGQPVVFDCIEFSEELRNIDTICDIAFLVMDFKAHDKPELGYHFLNAYLEKTGDYAGLTLLPFYCAYRALVRAKVCALGSKTATSEHDKKQLLNECHRYVDLALDYTEKNKPFILITHGVSGSGKTTITTPLIETLHAIRIRSDVERKRLHQLTAAESSHSGLKNGIYTAEKTAAVYNHLSKLARIIIEANYPVIIDATFLEITNRRKVYALAKETGAPILVLNFIASDKSLRDRIKQRMKRAEDASEADISVMEHQLKKQALLDKSEQDIELTINTDTKMDYPQLVSKIRSKLTEIDSIDKFPSLP